MNILDMVNLRDMKVMTTEMAISLRWLTAAMGRSELRFLRIASLLSSLRLLKNVRKTFQTLTRRLYLCIISPILYIDAIHYSVRDNGVIRKLAAYVILGINTEGKKEVLTIQVGDNESSKYWLSVLNELKNRGVKDILVICADGLTGIKEAIGAAFPKTEYQRCIVHQVRNTLKYVPDKDRKAFATDLKTIYQASDEKKALVALVQVTEKWTPKYPNAMKRWKDNWDVISPIFKFSSVVRKVIYTTNAIESLNSTYRKLNRQRSVFPSDTALLKALYLATFEATKKWTTTIRNWAQVYGELSIMYEGRLPE